MKLKWQQEPVAAVAWQQGYDQGVADERISEANIGIAGFGAKVNPARNNPYTSPQPAQQEPVATITITQRGPIRIIDNNFDDCVRGWPDGEYNLYTFPQPAQRTWVGLTDEKIWQEYQFLFPFHPAEEPRLAADIVTFARAIEAAHGITSGAATVSSKEKLCKS